MFNTILLGLVAYIPALSANSLAVVFGGGKPIDGGLRLGDNRVLGDGKTWRGLIGGTISAGSVGISLYLAAFPFYNLYPNNLVGMFVPFSFSFGAMFGDMSASFIKRRLGRKRGESSPFLDRYDFVVGSFLVGYLVYPSWVVNTYFSGQGLWNLLIILILVPLLHKGVNVIGYKIGVKKEPW